LVSPRNPLNIGAAARAMANFGFEHLTVVAPYTPHWREARSAIGAPEQLQNAREVANLAEAVTACTLIVGTGTLLYRKPEQRVVSLPALAPLVQQGLERGGRIALVFGPEKHGLTREDLSWCHLLVEIPTDPRQPSMNLGQAVAVCLYELAARTCAAVDALTEKNALKGPGFGLCVGSAEAGGALTNEMDRLGNPPQIPTHSDSPPAPSGSLDLLAGLIEEAMVAARYSPSSMQASNRRDLRLMLRRLAPSERDARRILGLFRRILWLLKRSPKAN
jgi:TrmH family RNA methyltransferase